MSLNILVVEDSATQQLVIKKGIKMAGFQVDSFVTALDGSDALTKLSSIDRVDLVTCDINMPNMNGLEFIAKLRSNSDYKDIPVVIITTEGTESKHHEAIAKGADGYIKKPFTPDSILEVLGKILKG